MSHIPFSPASTVPNPPLSIRSLPCDVRAAAAEDDDEEEEEEDGSNERYYKGRVLDKWPAHEGDRVTRRTNEFKTNLHVSNWGIS